VSKEKKKTGWVQWLTPVILAIWEVKIRRTVVPIQPGQKVHETPSTCHPSYTGSTNRRITVQAGWA
jgi:hypothetical protein